MIPSDLRWEQLTTPYGHVHPRGRKHAAFTEASLAAALTSGRDPAGNALDPAMPVYRMDDEDLRDLVAYLKQLEWDLDPGVAADCVRIGTLLPTQGRMAIVGRAIREALSASFYEVNAAGGIHGRRLELVEPPVDGSDPSLLESARRLLSQGDVFAILSPFVAGSDAEIGALAERERVPVIAPFTLLSPDPWELADFTFLLYAGPREQMRALVDFEAGGRTRGAGRIAMIGPQDERSRALREAIEEQWRRNGWDPAPEVIWIASDEEPDAAVARLRDREIETVFVLDPAGPRGWLDAAGAIDWRPTVLVPGAWAGPPSLERRGPFRGRVHLAYPTLPSDQTPAALAQLDSALARSGYVPSHRTAQVFAAASVRVIVEALKAAGRDLRREKLRAALEQLDGFRTGLTPPISYGANRRVGALGAYVVEFDAATGAFRPASGWIEPK